MKALVAISVILGLAFFLTVGGCSGMSIYNTMTVYNEDVNEKWSQVQNVYQRRTDLIPNLVKIVERYARHEKSTLSAVIEARAKASQITVDPSKLTPEMMATFQKSQGDLSQALGRLMVVMEQYPNLKADTGFLELQAQLEGTENRIAVARRDYNLSAKTNNTYMKTFPNVLVAKVFNFSERPYFKADEGAEKAPKIEFTE